MKRNREHDQIEPVDPVPATPAWADRSMLEAERTLELREEELVAHKELREVGHVEVRTVTDEVPGHLEVDALREEVEIEHVPVGTFVSERKPPWDEDGVLVVPVYEEQVVVTKRLLLREQLRIRRVATTQTQVFDDTLRKERVVIDDSTERGVVRERHPTNDDTPADADGGVIERLVRKALD
jgi:uncharacterized protein (TIGR02271 family)